MFDETIRNANGERIDYTFHGEFEPGGPIVLIGHGVTGNKDRPHIVALSEALSLQGIPALRFSFTGNGDSEGDFEQANITKEVGDLRDLLDIFHDEQVAYVGHSMGGAVGVALASNEPRIRYLVTLAGMVHTREFVKREFGDVTPGQGCMWEDEECPLSREFVEDLEDIQHMLHAGERIGVPWLLVHGEADDVVPIRDSLDIARLAPEQAELIAIPEADHIFSEAATPKMTGIVCDWLARRFRTGDWT